MGEDGALVLCARRAQKLFTGKESLTAGFYEIYLNRLKKKKEWSLSTG